MQVIYKYKINMLPSVLGAHNQLFLPEDALILDVQNQGGHPFVWVLQDMNPDRPKATWRYVVKATGEKIEDDFLGEYHYIGTFQLEEGRLVFHLFGCFDSVHN